jgi:hypothetical protein
MVIGGDGTFVGGTFEADACGDGVGIGDGFAGEDGVEG